MTDVVRQLTTLTDVRLHDDGSGARPFAENPDADAVRAFERALEETSRVTSETEGKARDSSDDRQDVEPLAERTRLPSAKLPLRDETGSRIEDAPSSPPEKPKQEREATAHELISDDVFSRTEAHSEELQKTRFENLKTRFENTVVTSVGQQEKELANEPDDRVDGVKLLEELFRPQVSALSAYEANLNASVRPSVVQMSAPNEVPRLDALVSRILVSAPEQNLSRVSMTLGDGIFKGTEVLLERDALGALKVKISTEDASAFQTLVGARTDLLQALQNEEKSPVDLQMQLNEHGSSGTDSDAGHGRSRGLDRFGEDDVSD